MNEDPNVTEIRIIAPDQGRIYPCQYCSKVFSSPTQHESHMEKCKSEIDILKIIPQNTNIPSKLRCARTLPKIEVKQNIVLDQKLNIEDVLNNSPSLKLSIKRSPIRFTHDNHSELLKNKDLTLPSSSSSCDNDNDEDLVDDCMIHRCTECGVKFKTHFLLLRHSRLTHNYRKITMALSEIKKFYEIDDMTKCPICERPLKSGYRSAYLKHLHTHTNELYHYCKVCKLKFRRMDHMKAHEKRHVAHGE